MAAENNIVIRRADLSDIKALHEIESLGFPPGKAATAEAFEYRLTHFPEWFFKAEADGVIAGLINGSCSDQPYITDDLYKQGSAYSPDADNLLIYGLAVHPDFRHTGLAHRLMDHFIKAARENGKKHISLTCKESLIGFYEGMGYKSHGVSESVIGDVVSYDMEMYLD